MKNPIKTAYHNICNRIYSVGKNHSEGTAIMRLHQSAIVEMDSILYPGAQIINLSNDRFRIRLGQNCHIYGSLTVFSYGGDISFGDNCSLGDYSRVVSCKSIKIGNRVMIAHNVNILDNNSHPIDARLRHEDFMSAYSSGMKEFDIKAERIVIEDDVWIGFNSIVLKGVTIGRGAIIGAGSVVTKDVEAWTINVGNPLRCVQYLQPQND